MQSCVCGKVCVPSSHSLQPTRVGRCKKDNVRTVSFKCAGLVGTATEHFSKNLNCVGAYPLLHLRPGHPRNKSPPPPIISLFFRSYGWGKCEGPACKPPGAHKNLLQWTGRIKTPIVTLESYLFSHPARPQVWIDATFSPLPSLPLTYPNLPRSHSILSFRSFGWGKCEGPACKPPGALQNLLQWTGPVGTPIVECPEGVPDTEVCLNGPGIVSGQASGTCSGDRCVCVLCVCALYYASYGSVLCVCACVRVCACASVDGSCGDAHSRVP